MAKKQTRRSISVSRVTYERLKAFCESNGISMSQFVESRVGDFLGEGMQLDDVDGVTPVAAPAMSLGSSPALATSPMASALRSIMPSAPRPAPIASAPRPVLPPRPMVSTQVVASAPRPAPPLTSAAARFAIEPPPPIIKPKAAEPAPPVVPRTADQIFTF